MEQAANGGLYTTLFMVVGMVVIFYFFVIRPQKKRDKENAQMRDSLKIGDVVVTIGGIVGIVTSIKEDVLILETGNDKNKVRIKKWAVREIEKLQDN